MRRILLAALLAVACRDLPDVTVEGEHIVIAADPGLELCGGSIAHLDEFIDRLSQEFGLEPPTGDDRVLGYWLRADDFTRRSGCPDGAVCATREGFYSWWLPVNHEVAHAVLLPHGRSIPLLGEGVAMAYQGLGDDVANGGVSLEIDVASLVGIRDSGSLRRAKDGYLRAGNYVAFLVENYGPAAVRRLMSLVGRRADAGEIDRGYREALGVSVDETLEAYRSEVRYCSQSQYDAKLIECAAPELRWQGGRIAEYRAIACEQDDAVGPYTGNTVVVFRTLKIADAGRYTIESFGDVEANRIAVHPCGGCDDDEGFTITAGESARTEWLAAGTYSVRMLGPANAQTSVGLRMMPAP